MIFNMKTAADWKIGAGYTLNLRGVTESLLDVFLIELLNISACSGIGGNTESFDDVGTILYLAKVYTILCIYILPLAFSQTGVNNWLHSVYRKDN